MSAFDVPPETRLRQRLATDPTASCFVAANAGSGKTYVLSRRVIRLLLAGVDPGRILCLTFTKAAAAEMANRVFEVLGAWTTESDGTLAAEIEALDGAAPDRERLARARRLFARALETPGGLKVQTLHAFCEALLQRFSVEANLPGGFAVLDDPGAALLAAEAKARTLREAALQGDAPLGRALAELLSDCTDAVVDGALRACLKERRAIAQWIGAAGGTLDLAIDGLPPALGIPAGASEESLAAAAAVSPHFDAAVLSALIPVLDGATSSMRDLAADFRAALAAPAAAQRELWRAIFLKTDGDPRSATRAITQAVETAVPGARDRFEAEGRRLQALDRAIAGVRTARRTAALMRIADRVIGHYEAFKAREGALDYDDLVDRAAQLLARSDAAAWVQYKLDQGIDHVLVDEAQDTSPRQWDIVDALTAEFFAGQGARGPVVRTLFAVGDEKQSIYSFQGAAPKLFGEARNRVRSRAAGSGAPFHDIELVLSFRSTPDVVKAVDRVFAEPSAHRGLATEPKPPVHETVRAAEPGLVEVWAETVAEPAAEPARWEDPVDTVSAGSPELRLAQRIADTVSGWIRDGERIAATGKRIRAGDVLILVRKRGAFVDAVNRALKARGVPIAGADRLDVVRHIVAEDLMAAARVALLPEDDLTLAAVAKSPLVGLSEDELFTLAAHRGGGLFAETEAQAAAGSEPAGRLLAAVSRWRARADTETPFAFFARLVGADGGRAAFRARIGHEADEVIDEFLRLALAFEEREVPTLDTFLARLADADDEVKREVAEGRDEVRVMTVHGAKGLEAPVVFLVDPGSPPVSASHDPALIGLGDGPGRPLVWVQSGLKPEPVETALAAARAAQDEEYRRLLYVGLTRAGDRLIVAGTRGARSSPDGRWHTLVRHALSGEAEALPGPDGEPIAWRWRLDPSRPARTDADEAADVSERPPLPAFLTVPAPQDVAPRAVTPSAALAGAGRVKTVNRRDPLDRARSPDAPAALRGRLVHRLFEVLPDVPPADRGPRALAFLTREAPHLPDGERERLWSGVEAVLSDPRFAVLFGPTGRAEVGLVGEIPVDEGRPLAVSGQVDRLVVDEAGVLIVDYKTNRVVPDDVPDDYVAQLALYRRLLGDLYPGRPVRAGILWTEAIRFDEVAADRMDAMLSQLLTAMGSGRDRGRS